MLSFNEWDAEIDRLETAIHDTNRKIDYRCLQILGPEPPIDLMRGIGRKSSRDYGRTQEEYDKTSSDSVIQKLYSMRADFERKLDYLRRTGEKLEDVNVEEAFE